MWVKYSNRRAQLRLWSHIRTCVIQVVLQPAFCALVVKLPASRQEKQQVVSTKYIFFIKHADRNPFQKSVLRNNSSMLPCMSAFVGVESGKQSRELQQYGDAAAVRVCAVRQPLKQNALNITSNNSEMLIKNESSMMSLPEQLRKSRSEPPGR